MSHLLSFFDAGEHKNPPARVQFWSEALKL